MIDYKEIEHMRNLNDSLIWDRMKTCYDYGYNRGCKDKEEEIGEIRRKEYHRGYDDGVANTPFTDTEKAEKSAYQRGLEDAWECAREIVDMSDKQLSGDYELVSLYHVFNEMSASEAMQKIKDYEEKRECDNCKRFDDECDGHAFGCKDYEERQTDEAEWLDYSYARKCSKCGSITCWTDDDGEPIPDNFCPNCGAKMRKESE